jgi:hypothetical protein
MIHIMISMSLPNWCPPEYVMSMNHKCGSNVVALHVEIPHSMCLEVTFCFPITPGQSPYSSEMLGLCVSGSFMLDMIPDEKLVSERHIRDDRAVNERSDDLLGGLPAR